ncbi:MAG TPA: DNA polymerase, partial [Candidatus Kapabacteria bacterium]|nr:DNA polymerase [Candidatus Kapabacteria bacterium]
MAEKLFLFDGMALAYRAYFAFISRPLTNPKGENVSAVYGFVSALLKVIEDEKPDHIAVCFDTKEPTFRHKEYPEYKAQRQAIPDDMIPQLQTIKDVVRAFNIQLIELPGWEADDVIGTLAKMAEKEKVEAYMVTPDKDYCQLVSKLVKVYRPPRFGNEYEILDIEGVKKKFGVPPEHVIDYLGLVGDTADNVPGVKGVGEKTALPLVQKYGTIENLYKHLNEIDKESLRKKLEESRDMALLSKKLVTIDTEAPVKINFHELKSAHPNKPLLREMFTELNFKSYIKKFEDIVGESSSKSKDEDMPVIEENVESNGSASAQEQAHPHGKFENVKTQKHIYKIIQDEKELEKMVATLEKAKRVSFDLETTSITPMMAEIVGISFSIKPHEGYYIPVEEYTKKSADMGLFTDAPPKKAKTDEKKHDGKEYSNLNTSFVVEKIKSLLENKKVPKVGQNIKYDALVMRNYGVDVQPVEFDSMVAAYVIRPDGAHDMDSLSLQYLNYSPVPITDLIGEGKNQINMRDVPIAQAAEYAAEDADVTLQLVNAIEKKLKQDRLDAICEKIEFPLIPVLVELEYNGVKIDTKLLEHISKELERNAENLEREIYKLTGSKFNISSTKQLGEILFEKLKLPTLKKTKTGYSTDVSVLEELADMHPVPAKILEFRQTVKLRSTYVEALPKQINPRTG